MLTSKNTNCISSTFPIYKTKNFPFFRKSVRHLKSFKKNFQTKHGLCFFQPLSFNVLPNFWWIILTSLFHSCIRRDVILIHHLVLATRKNSTKNIFAGLHAARPKIVHHARNSARHSRASRSSQLAQGKIESS